jgi:hypothetical protein
MRNSMATLPWQPVCRRHSNEHFLNISLEHQSYANLLSIRLVLFFIWNIHVSTFFANSQTIFFLFPTAPILAVSRAYSVSIIWMPKPRSLLHILLSVSHLCLSQQLLPGFLLNFVWLWPLRVETCSTLYDIWYDIFNCKWVATRWQ